MGKKKRIPTVTNAALRRAIAGGETSTIELKKAVPGPGELAERMCRMANALRGMIIIGVEDSRLTVVSVPEAHIAIKQNIVLWAVRQIDPPLLLGPALYWLR